MIDDTISWASMILYYASPVVAFWLTAMAWQRYPYRAFFMLALSSMLMVLLVFMGAVEARQQLDDADRLACWRCRNLITIIDGVLYPWSLFLLFRFIRERTKSPSENSDEQNAP